MDELSQLAITIGTYSKCIRQSQCDTDLPFYAWTCMVYLAGRPYADIGPIIEKVEFTLHKSFPNV